MKKLSSICFWFIFVLYMEMILKIALFDNAFNINLVYMIFLIIPIALLFKMFTSLFASKVNKIISYVLIISTTIIFVAQLVYYKTYLSIFSIYSMGKAEQLVDYVDTIIKIIWQNIFFIGLLIIPIIVFIIFNKHFMGYERDSIRKTLVILVGIIFFQVAGNLSLQLSSDDTYSAKQLYYDIHSPTLSTNKLGLLTTMRLDLKRMIIGFKEKSELGTVPVQNSNDKKDEVEEKPVTYNVLDIDFDSLIQNESNKTVKELHEYFKNATPTNQNEYTGMFKGKNLIVFLAESFYPLAIDKDLTPTLYKLSTEGFDFTNFYTPVFPVSTTDGEYIMATSLIPKEGVWSSYRSSKDYYPFVLGNAFKNLGYKTTAYHDHTATYYERDEYIPNWGYDFYACGKGLNINCKRWPESDVEMIDASYDAYATNEPFMTYYITVSGHLRYTKSGNSIASKNWSYVKDLPYSEGVKAYIACNIELDKALESLINHLKETSTLDNTVIALSADHYPYGLTLDEINERSTYIRDDNFEKHKNDFILWNSMMKPIKVDKLSSSLDILPTLLNLFGVPYDSRMLMGKDVFADTNPIVIFSNRSFITEKGRYNAITNSFESNNGKEVSKDYISNTIQTVNDRYYLSRNILDTNYYKKANIK